MARCGRPQFGGQRQGAARRAPQLRAEPRHPTVSKRGHQPPRCPAVGRVVISGNGAGSRVYKAGRLRAGRRSGRRRGREAGGAVRHERHRPGRGRGGAGGALRPARAPTFLGCREETGGTGTRSLSNPRPSLSVRLPERGAVPGEGRQSRAGDGVTAGARGRLRRVARVCACGPGQLGEGGGRALQVHARPRCPHAPARALGPLHQSGVGAESGMGEPRAGSGTSGQSLPEKAGLGEVGG